MKPHVAFRFACFFAVNLATPLLLSLLLLTSPAMAQSGGYTYTTNDGAITITGYTGPGGAVTIPDTIARLPVTRIGD